MNQVFRKVNNEQKTHTLKNGNEKPVHKFFSLPPIDGLFCNTLVCEDSVKMCCETKHQVHLLGSCGQCG